IVPVPRCLPTVTGAEKMLLGVLSLVVLTELSTMTFCIEIVSGPLTVSNALLGDIARFECVLSSEDLTPRWNIMEPISRFHLFHLVFQFESHSTLKVLIVNPVKQELNNTCFYCFLLLINARAESPPAKLIIQPPLATRSFSSSSRQPQATSSLQLMPTLGYSSSSTWQSIVTHSYSDTSLIGSTVTAESPATLPPILTPAVSMITTTKTESSTQLLIGVYSAVPTVLLISALNVAVIGYLIHCRHKRKKGVKQQERVHVYEDVDATIPASPTDVKQQERVHVYEDVDATIPASPTDVKQNPAYSTTFEVKENPAYITTTMFTLTATKTDIV
ncbi:hypothetical protein GBAR_LOCUS19765, partial [Geodia barretti]